MAAECFSCEQPASARVQHGAGTWWNALLIPNTGADKEKKPFGCALGCGHTWGAKTATATKVAGHIVGDLVDVKFCKKATADDIALATGQVEALRKRRSSRTRNACALRPWPASCRRSSALAAVDSGCAGVSVCARSVLCSTAFTTKNKHF